jgi:hypothetical protein
MATEVSGQSVGPILKGETRNIGRVRLTVVAVENQYV